MTLVLRAGPNLKGSRFRAVDAMEAGGAALLAVYAAAVVTASLAGAWFVDRAGAPNAFDFAEFWSAGRVAAAGHAARAYDWSVLAEMLRGQGTHAFDRAGFPFFYPPPVLLALVPLGRLPYAAAAGLWFAVSVGAWLGVVRVMCSRRAGRLALAASPAVFLCAVVGQTGLMVAVVAEGALLALPRRPVLAGLLLAVVAMKPQTAVLFPLALAAAGRWRALAACAVALAGLGALSLLAFGPGVWVACLHALHPAAGAPAPLAGLPPAKLQSVYGLILTLGAGPGPAMAVQGGFALAVAAWIVWLWRVERPFELKAAGLCAAALLVSPYSAVYDLPVATVAVGFLLRDAARRPLGRLEGAAMAIAYLLPLLFLVAPFPYGPEVCVLLCAVVGLRCRSRREVALPPRPTAAVTA